LPVVYAGDVNSHEGHPLDGPAVAMGATGTADAQLVAPHRTNVQYNSANQYRRTPPKSGLALDRIYASPGVAVGAWRQVLELSGGRLVGVIPSDHNAVVADLVVPR
jgi:endonuclease/exonuclease/phosphatase family metal-dependent hydrolase